MIGQNILKGNKHGVDLKIDSSETYDFYLDKTGWVDLALDYSEFHDCQLDFSVDYILPIVYDKIVSSEFGCDYTILTQDQFSILTQNGECIQYQH